MPNKNGRNIFFLLCILSLLLCASGCGRNKEPEASAAETETADIPESETEKNTVSETDEESSPPNPSSGIAPQVTVSPFTKDWYSKDGNAWLIHADYEMADVGGAAEALVDALEKWSAENEAQILSYGDRLTPEAEEYAAVPQDYMEENCSFYIGQALKVTRADSRVLSFLVENSSYLGGAHENYGYGGTVFDSQTGDILALDDILTDSEGFRQAATQAIIEKLNVKYGDDLFPDYTSTVEEIWENEPAWYLDAVGLTFAFEPYLLGPYAMGGAFITLPYGDFSAYLKPGYVLPQSDETIAVMTENEEISVGLIAGKDSLSTVSLLSESEEDYSETQVSLRVDGNDLKIGTFARIGAVYYLCTEDSRKYVLLDADHASGDFVSFVYDITDGKAVETDRVEGLSIQGGTLNTQSMRLSMCVEVLGTYSASMDYELGKDGKLIQLGEMFEISGGETLWNLLTTVRELPVTMDNGGKSTLPAGTSLRIIGTDNQGTARFQVDGTGDEGSISYTRGSGTDDGQTIYIDGVSEYGYFESIPYAG